MTINPMSAANAYATVAKLTGNTQPGKATASPASDTGVFSEMVSKAVDNVSESGKTMETQAVSLANGETDMVDLVTAVAETELALETLVSVRDRVISAYQDILNMPI